MPEEVSVFICKNIFTKEDFLSTNPRIISNALISFNMNDKYRIIILDFQSSKYTT